MSDSLTKTYVYDNTEVKLTGRQAEKKTETKARGRRAGSTKVDTLHEITPAGDGVASWKQWVRMTDLYEIEDN